MADICVTVARRRHAKVFEEMELGAQMGVRLMEIRLDYLGVPRLGEILAQRKCPLIATVRRQVDGGQWNGREAQRQQLLKAAIVDGFDYVDLEYEIADKIPRYGSTKRIVSHHELKRMLSPRDLRKLYKGMVKRDADVAKIACRASSPTDIFAMFDLLREVEIPTIAICMGDMGVPSRVLGAKFGSPYTYAAFSSDRLVAHGMLTLSELRDIYHYEQINAETEVYGVIGDPIRHSLSPLVHNTCFREALLNKVYVPFRVPAESLDDFMHTIHNDFGVQGLSVTIPHKVAICKHGVAVDPLVKAIESANTLVSKGAWWELSNTDGQAALESIEAALPPDPVNGSKSIAKRQVLLLGAGGVARTIAHCLQQKGAFVSITNRHLDRALELAREVGCQALDWAQRHTRIVDVVINCTPVGMFPNTDESPFAVGGFRPGMVVFDTIYNPETTLFLAEAKKRDCITVTGVEMFVRQAEAQFKLYTGQIPLAGLMATLVREELSPASKMLREARLGSGSTS